MISVTVAKAEKRYQMSYAEIKAYNGAKGYKQSLISREIIQGNG